MADLSPTPFIWKNQTLIPATAYQLKRCQDHFEDGQRVFMVEHQERSIRTHNHYFASLAEAWMNLPEDEALKYPDSETLRKRALIFTGWRNETITVCATPADAMRLAALIESLDPFAVNIVRDCTVTTLRAKSQSMKAMGKKDFAKSKSDVLAWCWNLVGVDPETGNANAGQAA